MEQRIYQVDAFTDKIFSGNPAAVCPLDYWLDDDVLQKIAIENNLAETAFYVNKNDIYQIRWFTPVTEVDLCGHATLASAYVLFNYENHQDDVVKFYSPRSGNLEVIRKNELLTLNFPTDKFDKIEINESMKSAFNIKPKHVYRGKTDFLFVFENENDIKTIVPDLRVISLLGGRGTIVTGRGDDVDFVSRFFAPQSGIDEDPVTGSAHTTLTPYWSKELSKKKLSSVQLSKRCGYLSCEDLGDRVEISGQCRLYMKGNIYVK